MVEGTSLHVEADERPKLGVRARVSKHWAADWRKTRSLPKPKAGCLPKARRQKQNAEFKV